MGASVKSKPSVLMLAQRIEQDIEQRRLAAGERYLTVDEVARQLRVSKLSANQAIQLLVHRRVLDRRKRRGTFVAGHDSVGTDHPIQLLLFLVHNRFLQSEGVLADDLTVGISRHLPGTDMRFAFLPDIDEATFVQEKLIEIQRLKRSVGIVLVRTTLQTQRLVVQSGLPAVLLETPHASVTDLSSIEADQRQTGRLLAQHVLQRGHRQIVVLMHERIYPGDHAFMDSIRTMAMQAGLSADALSLRSVPADDAELISVVQQAVIESAERPGLIARSENIGVKAMTAIELLGLSEAQDVAVGIATLYRRGNEKPPVCAHVRCEANAQEQGELLASLLCDAARGKPARCIQMPVQLVCPAKAGCDVGEQLNV